jgi:hypothetical protein
MVLETREIGGDISEEKQDQNTQPEKDFKPEYCQYRDEGCEYAKACLDCPFPQCLYDEPRGRQHWMKQTRDKEIKRLFDQGKKVKELAIIFGVSQRTIQRALRV